MAAVALVLNSIELGTVLAAGKFWLEKGVLVTCTPMHTSIWDCCFAESPLLFGVALLYLGALRPPIPGDPVPMLVASPFKPSPAGERKVLQSPGQPCARRQVRSVSFAVAGNGGDG